jgi:carbon-monoxide dehydrogenase medium subunit
MYPFTYLRPQTLDEAAALLAAHPEARPLAGGMTLVPTLKQRLAAPSHLVDLTRLPALRGIAREGGVLRVGATTPHALVASSAVVREALPALATLAGLIGDAQVRSRGTIGGSVANSDPGADYPAAVLGLGASVVTERRRIGADDFFRGLFETALAPGEIVCAVEFPLPRRAAYAKHRHPASGYAVAGVFIAETADGAWRVAVTGAGPCAFRWREAEARLAERGARAGALDGLALAAQGLNDDLAASADYRAHLAGVQARRALAALH